MKKSFQTVLFILFAYVLLFSQDSDPNMHLVFKESTFDQFAYPDAEVDEAYTAVIRQQSNIQFNKASERRVKSYITLDKPRKVVSYYSNLCGKRFQKKGERFTYIFSEIKGLPATRIEIYPIEMGRTHREFWPTRIDLYIIRYPLTVDVELEKDRSLEGLKERIGRYVYDDGRLIDDISLLYMEELGSDAEVFIIETGNDFDEVYKFFRRLYGPFHVRPARDGDLLTRDFEIDISLALGPNDQDKELFLFVEENPLIADRSGNTQLYRNRVFIRYVFWQKSDTPIY